MNRSRILGTTSAAFVSDTFPICGRRRVPYMVVGLVGQAVAWGLMGMLPGSLLLFAGLVHPPAPPSSPATWVLYTEELCV